MKFTNPVGSLTPVRPSADGNGKTRMQEKHVKGRGVMNIWGL